MKTPNPQSICLLALIACITVAANSEQIQESITVSEILTRFDAELEWNPVRESGTLVLGPDSVSFKINAPWVLFNYRTIVPASVVWNSTGEILFSSETVAKLDELLGRPQKGGWMPSIAAILIDPGHGGRDPGTIGVHDRDGEKQRIMEKDLVLVVGTYLWEMLRNRYPDKNVFLTRDRDLFLTLEQRVELANNVELARDEAIIFVSIHANAAFSSLPKGFEVWYLPNEYRRTVEDVESVGMENQEILPILNAIREEDISIESVFLATTILQGLDATIGNRTENRGLKEETWFVVRNAMMPSVLVEIGFVTNPEEAELLETDEYLQKIARGIYTGINRFVKQFENGAH